MRRLTWGILLAAVVAAMVWGGWEAVSTVQQRATSDEDDQPIRVTASVERRTLEETVVTRGVVGFPAASTATAAASGRVTAVGVSPGAKVNAGDIILEVDGRPMVAVEGSTPFWRDLVLGMRGPDVAQLQRLLAAQGHDPGADDGRFGGTTRSALRAWQEEHGIDLPDGVLRLNDVLVGKWPQRLGRVAVRPADFVSPGGELFSFTAPTPAVTVELVPSDRLRVEVGDPARVEVSATGATAEGKVAEASLTPMVRDDGSLVYPATVALEEPLEVPEGTQSKVVIVLDRAEGVVAAPLAAVVSDGEGDPMVRVVRLDGSVEAVPVDLGISQGAWVEIAAGLAGDETVVVIEQ